jgi:hypothetical protein
MTLEETCCPKSGDGAFDAPSPDSILEHISVARREHRSVPVRAYPLFLLFCEALERGR